MLDADRLADSGFRFFVERLDFLGVVTRSSVYLETGFLFRLLGSRHSEGGEGGRSEALFFLM